MASDATPEDPLRAAASAIHKRYVLGRAPLQGPVVCAGVGADAVCVFLRRELREVERAEIEGLAGGVPLKFTVSGDFHMAGGAGAAAR